MNRDAFPGTNPRACTARSHTRRRLHEPRPAVAPEVRARIGLWKTQVKAACLAGHIGKSDDKYALELLAIPSIARGDYCLYSDRGMGRRINVSSRTIRRHRKALADQGLIEVLGHGKDHKPCMVRPILRDGSPVFLDPKLAGRSDTNGRLTRPVVAAELLLTEEPKGSPPLPPAALDVTEKGERAFELVEDKAAETVEVKPEVEFTAEPAEESVVVKPAMSFLQFWVAMGQTGREGYARAQWAKLSATDKAAIRERLSRPRSWAADMWAGTWLKGRCWEEAVPAAARPEQVFIRENTPEWRCWQRHLVAIKGKGTPVDNRGGWWFPSRLPPLAEATTSIPTAVARHSA
jgi:hypothetical protein